jgi:hypothetical protein
MEPRIIFVTVFPHARIAVQANAKCGIETVSRAAP